MNDPAINHQPVLTPVHEAHRFDEDRLAAYLVRHIDDFTGDMKLEQYVGGTSNPTFHITSGGNTSGGNTSGDNTSGNNEWVMRKRPPGNLLPSAHQVEREYRVMHALRDSDVPVPKMLHFCDDESVIGQTFYIMSAVHGRITTSEMVGFEPAERRAIYEDFLRVLAALHQVDHLKVGLEKHGRPGNYFARQIDRWTKQYRGSQTDDIPEMEKLIEWMPKHVPDDDTTGIIHGDYRIGNVLIHPTEPKIAAVLDWELSTLGHPLGDLGYHGAYAYYNEFTLYKDELGERGIPTEEEYLSLYCELTGRDSIPNWHFYVAYNLFRLAGIIQGVYKRGLDGNVSSELDITSQHESVKIRAQRAWALVQEMERTS
ncbi:MAG: phosphotransferase family protein [Pseudomonadota bacterium]